MNEAKRERKAESNEQGGTTDERAHAPRGGSTGGRVAGASERANTVNTVGASGTESDSGPQAQAGLGHTETKQRNWLLFAELPRSRRLCCE